MENFVTSLILTGPVYLLVFNLISLSNYEQMQKLEIIVQNAFVNLGNLQVREVFQLDVKHKLNFLEEHGLGSVIKDEGMPYERTIE